MRVFEFIQHKRPNIIDRYILAVVVIPSDNGKRFSLAVRFPQLSKISNRRPSNNNSYGFLNNFRILILIGQEASNNTAQWLRNDV